jgi:hypothetical protein
MRAITKCVLRMAKEIPRWGCDSKVVRGGMIDTFRAESAAGR